MSQINQKMHSCEIWTDKDSPITGVMMADKKLFELEKDCGWEITKIFTDYTLEYNSHKYLIVVLEPKENDNREDNA